MKSESYKRKVDTRGELLAGTLDPAACCQHKETWRSNQTKNTRSSYMICKDIEDDGAIFEHLLLTITNVLIKH
jgi:hypothetical protein